MEKDYLRCEDCGDFIDKENDTYTECDECEAIICGDCINRYKFSDYCYICSRDAIAKDNYEDDDYDFEDDDEDDEDEYCNMYYGDGDEDGFPLTGDWATWDYLSED